MFPLPHQGHVVKGTHFRGAPEGGTMQEARSHAVLDIQTNEQPRPDDLEVMAMIMSKTWLADRKYWA